MHIPPGLPRTEKLTTRFLARCRAERAARVPQVLLVRDNAALHISAVVRGWSRAHHPQGSREGWGVRVIADYMLRKSLWPTASESKWVRGKRRVDSPRVPCHG